MTFENLNKNTKKAMGFIDNFNCHKGDTLFDIYSRPSSRKVSIFNSLKNELENDGFYNISCVAGGSGYFTMAGENNTHIAYITYAHNFLIEK